MKRIFIALLSTCLYLANVYSDDTAEWISFRQKTIKLLPSIPGWCPVDKATRMMNLIRDTKPDMCVEVGIFGGSSYIPTLYAMQYNKQGIGFAIDPWDTRPCVEGQTAEHLAWWKKVDLRSIFNGFVDLLHTSKLDRYSAILRMTSKDALPFFKDASIDILHIDGNHAEASALFDAMNWLPKVKVGGYIWFDDTNWDSTHKAVEYLLQYCEIDPDSHMNDPYMLFKKVKSGDTQQQFSI